MLQYQNVEIILEPVAVVERDAVHVSNTPTIGFRGASVL
jgi:hypothetical protein